MRGKSFTELFRPGRIGRLELKNRIVMAPMGTYLANRDGTVIERLKRYYEERARGGAGLIVIEIAAIDHPRGRGLTRQLGISDDKFIPGLSEMAESVHRHGAKAAIQLHHGGRIASPLLSGGSEAVAPSTVPLIPAELGSARELTLDEIAHLVECYAGAALRARKAGLDGVEIHAGHGYLIGQFLSRSVNKRQDQYGGSLENRARFLLEIIAAVRQQAGAEFPVWCRLDGREFSIEDGITREEALKVARMAAAAGLDALHVSGYGGSDNVHFTEAPLVNRPGYLVPLARDIKKAVNIPVIAVGRISPEMGENILRKKEADFIAFGRPLIADPELPNKLAAGKPDEIRRCIYCYTCVHQIFVRNNVCCAINAAAGKESEIVLQPAKQAKKVLVIGGGPAGMEAARVAALRGHQVSLYEKEKRLGGSLLYAAIVRRENEEVVKYLASQLKKLNVQVNPGTHLDPEALAKIKPDVIILAAGALRSPPPIPGIGLRNVIDGNDLRYMLNGRRSESLSQKLSPGQKTVLALGGLIKGPLSSASFIRLVSRGWMPLGKRVAVIGGGLIGCELAAFLVERRRRVTILERGEQVAAEMALPMKWMVLDKLQKSGVEILTRVNFKKITGRGIEILEENGQTRVVEADTIIEAEGIEPDKALIAAFQGKAPEVYAVGDCAKISLIKDSIAEAYKIASTI